MSAKERCIKQAKDLNLVNSAENTNKFNYHEVKAMYLKKIREHYHHVVPSDVIKTNDYIQNMITELTWTNHPPKSVILVSQYDVVNVADPDPELNPNGCNILTPANDPFRQVLSYEQSFDVFAEAYVILEDPTLEKMLQMIEENYVVNKLCLITFLQCCLENSSEQIKEPKFNDRVELQILDLIDNPDNNFKYILVYVDLVTTFILLRPLIEFNEHEVSSELYQIFIDFGPPKIIENGSSDIINKVMVILHNTPMKYNCTIVNKSYQDSPVVNYVASELGRWTTAAKSCNWALGCYIIQTSINTVGEISSLSKVFGNKSSNSNVQSDQNNPLNEFPSTSKSQVVQKKKESVKNMNNLICQQCYSTIIFKAYKCHLCEKLFHLICVNRVLVQQLEDTYKSKIVCFSCE